MLAGCPNRIGLYGGGGGGVSASSNVQMASLGVGQAADGVAGNVSAAGYRLAGSATSPSKSLFLDSSGNVAIDGGGFRSVTFNTSTGEAVFGNFPVRLGQTTVASLPAGNLGDEMVVTDGTAALAWGATVTGGGSTKYLVWYNGTAWTVAGK